MTTSTPEDGVAYCTLEQIQETLDQADALRLNRRIADACRSASRDLEGVLHRRFYPQTGTRYLDFRWAAGDTMWVNNADCEVITCASLVVDGTTLTEGVDFYLDLPGGNGPPYTAIRLYRDAATTWSSEPRGNVFTGTVGGSAGTAPAGALAAAVSTSDGTTITVTNSSLIGVGDLLLCDTERMTVSSKALTTTTATVTGAVAADEAVTTIPVSSGALVHAGEMILSGAERMYVEDVVGNNLIVKRAQNASVLETHANADVVYAPRLLTVKRGAAGTTAAQHLTAATLVRNLPPALVSEAAAALAINFVEQGKAGYARTAGAGDHQRASGGTGVAAAVAAAVEAAYVGYGRKGRIGAC